MTILAIRYRAEGALVVLQVSEKTERDGPYTYDSGPKWRDALVEDLLEVAKLSVSRASAGVEAQNAAMFGADGVWRGAGGYV